MIEHDFPEEFVPIAAELQRLPYLSPSRNFADRVISGIDRLQPAHGVAPVIASRHLELQQGGRQTVAPLQRRKVGLVRGTGRAVAGIGLVAAAAFMFFEIDVLTAILSAAATQYGFAMAASICPPSSRDSSSSRGDSPPLVMVTAVARARSAVTASGDPSMLMVSTCRRRR